VRTPQDILAVQRTLPSTNGQAQAAPDMRKQSRCHLRSVPNITVNGRLFGKVFFSVAHDPTQLNQKGPDVGTQLSFRNFLTASAEQNESRKHDVDQLNQAKVFPKSHRHPDCFAQRIFYPRGGFTTRITPTNHQKTCTSLINDLPKVRASSQAFPELYVEKK